MSYVLVVDDEADVRRAFCVVLARAGHEVAEAADGRQALELCRARVPDVIVTDLLMPEMDGLELIVAVRRTWAGVRLLAVTGSGTHGRPQEDRLLLEEAARLGAAGNLAKPVQAQVLVAAVARLLEAMPRE